MTVLYQTLASSSIRTSPDQLHARRQKDVAADGGNGPVGGVELRPTSGTFHVLEERVFLQLAQVDFVERLGWAQEHVEQGAEGAEDEDQEGGEEADVDVLGAAADVLPGPDEGGGPDGGAKGGQQRKDDGDGLADGFHASSLRVGAALDCRRVAAAPAERCAVARREVGRGCARKSFFQKTLEARRDVFRLKRGRAGPRPATDGPGVAGVGSGVRVVEVLPGQCGETWVGRRAARAGTATGGRGSRTKLRACAGRRESGGGEGGAISRQPEPPEGVRAGER